MVSETEKKKKKKLHLAIIKQLVALSTSGFGLVAALAWNNVVQELVNSYIKPFMPKGSTVISLLIYAILVTILAVTVTYNLSMLAEKVEEIEDRFGGSKSKDLTEEE